MADKLQFTVLRGSVMIASVFIFEFKHKRSLTIFQAELTLISTRVVILQDALSAIQC